VSSRYRFIATAPRGLTDLLARELSALGAEQLAQSGGSVHFEGALALGYRACLWSRVASRVLLVLAELQADSADEFHRQAAQIEWESHVSANGTLACDFSGVHPGITHSHFGALRLKDAVVDRLRERCGSRPQVELTRPAVRLHAHARGASIMVALDLSGESLHRRGYRREAGEAPLRENLAAGVLLRARWDEAAAAEQEFLDPLCGSGTLVIEAAMIAAHRAPGLDREYFGFLGWRGHDGPLWDTLREEARAQVRTSLPNRIRGNDVDARVLQHAQHNASRAGVAALVSFEHGTLAAVRPLAAAPGMICTNPPYGERLGDVEAARALHAQLGQVLRQHFQGWDAAILSAAPHAARELRLRSYRVHELWNGPIACRLLRIDLAAPGATDLMHRTATPAPSVSPVPPGGAVAGTGAVPAVALPADAAGAGASGATMFANRLEKNLRRLGRAARAAHVSCYRLYDADMPEYAFAIDRYEQLAAAAEATPCVHLYVQEYAAPASIDVQAARRRRREALSVLPGTLGVPPERIHLRVRRPQRGAAQYQARRRLSARGLEGAALANMITVSEAGLKFLVNLDDYLDTGLFLDHRLTRALLRERASGRRFLNLFCYTASATVCAAAAGARESLSIDLSHRYLQWSKANLALNGADPAQHRLLQADCLAWLGDGDAGLRDARRHDFDLIFLDPPTFSNSKRMQGVLDVQRDHVELIGQCMGRLAPGGTLIFSTNAQRFRLAAEVGERWRVEDLSRQTLPFDFQGNPRIHRCYQISAA
jgi:23S rRNA (guanine2445-N2)-methyltransferase / 23S rRNA (guanine2069-N7)-methyltransferase